MINTSKKSLLYTIHMKLKVWRTIISFINLIYLNLNNKMFTSQSIIGYISFCSGLLCTTIYMTIWCLKLPLLHSVIIISSGCLYLVCQYNSVFADNSIFYFPKLFPLVLNHEFVIIILLIMLNTCFVIFNLFILSTCI